ncbi:hypothetical protein AB0F17_45960 [Nonomuraea sp. NPDC026600]|uniref:hypothetical protein n=1 Tax=Nonomuraea sp. NPDC026600 TaxID=3155363 RepID=UPI0033CACA42
MAGVVTAGAVATLTVAGAGAAYAVETDSDGSVTVRIEEFAQPELLQAELKEAGIRASVTYVPDGQTCAPAAAGTQNKVISGQEPRLEPGQDGDGASFRIRKDQIKPDQTLVLMATLKVDDPAQASSMSLQVVEGQVTPCKLEKSTAGVKGVPIPAASSAGDGSGPPVPAVSGTPEAGPAEPEPSRQAANDATESGVKQVPIPDSQGQSDSPGQAAVSASPRS